ncbi:hypothetical protein PPROV_000776800 [Pycnococcus provasolii]|uniref:peptidylprolyl isomerase n=1 Tax=Pycnococcus provasolii TaxID=41880 RepID=A0A830HU54_9CHLO|nr:hypothetical protein PPROV_000776800 [Pycnococcus provasolii]
MLSWLGWHSGLPRHLARSMADGDGGEETPIEFDGGEVGVDTIPPAPASKPTPSYTPGDYWSAATLWKAGGGAPCRGPPWRNLRAPWEYESPLPRCRSPCVCVDGEGLVWKQTIQYGRDTEALSADMKVASSAGESSTSETIEEGDRLWVDYDGMLEVDGTRFDPHHERREPCQFIVGSNHPPNHTGFVKGVASMKRNETAIIYVHWSLGYGIEGHFSFPHVPSKANLVYVVTLRNFEKENGEIPRPDMFYEERIERAESRRHYGNEKFARGDVEGALAQYDVANSYVNDDMLVQLEGRHQAEVMRIKMPLACNRSLCAYKLGKLHECIGFANEVVCLKDDAEESEQWLKMIEEVQPLKLKARFRRAKARFDLGQMASCKEDIDWVLAREPNNAAVLALNRAWEKESQQIASAQKDLVGGLFGTADDVAENASWSSRIGGALGAAATNAKVWWMRRKHAMSSK